jgi:hypothetical protein
MFEGVKWLLECLGGSLILLSLRSLLDKLLPIPIFSLYLLNGVGSILLLATGILIYCDCYFINSILSIEVNLSSRKEIGDDICKVGGGDNNF